MAALRVRVLVQATRVASRAEEEKRRRALHEQDARRTRLERATLMMKHNPQTELRLGGIL